MSRVNSRKWFSDRSIFFKLLIVLVIAGAAANLTMFAVFHFLVFPQERFRHLADKNLIRYSQTLVSELGSPPSFEKAKALSTQLSVDFRYRDASGEWATRDSLPDFDDLLSRSEMNDSEGVRSGHFHTHMFVYRELKSPQGEIVFFPAHGPHGPRGPFGGPNLLFFVLISSVIAGAYLALKKFLRPIRSLTEGAHRIGLGQLDHQVPVQSRDELGKLAEAFNQMTAKIHSMMRGKEQLLLDVSHELRSPLTRLRLMLALLENEKHVPQMVRDIAEMEHMLNEILEGARLDSPHGALSYQQVDAINLVREMVEKYRSQSPSIQVSAPSESLSLEGDPGRLRIVLKNLIENALKYSGGSEAVQLRLYSEGDWVVFEVQDFGVGIDATEVSKVFDPFYRVDKSRSRETGGYGLGLSLSLKIVQAHRGTIELKSEPGTGTLATVKLPRVPRS